MANPIIAALRGDHLPRRAPRAAAAGTTGHRAKMYLYPDYINPTIAIEPRRLLGHPPRHARPRPWRDRDDYRAWHYEDIELGGLRLSDRHRDGVPRGAGQGVPRDQARRARRAARPPAAATPRPPEPVLPPEHLWHYIQWCKHIGGQRLPA